MAGASPCPTGGFTLIEIVISLGLLMIVLALLFYPITSSMGYFRTATARADAQTVARTALDAIARELSEAMYVQLDMYDNSMIAFIPPLRLNPADPNSEIVTPPRPDWSRAIRFWQALNDPTRNYNPGAYLEPSNMYFLARTVIEDPFKTNDAWNRWNDDWASSQTINLAGFMPGVSAWAAIPRAVNADTDTRYDSLTGTSITGARNRTLQPGYPYLALKRQYGTKWSTEAVRLYRNLVIGMTPNAPEYDVPQMSFNPTAVAGERLRAIDDASGPNACVYRARYPLWRQGTTYTGWSALAGNPQLIGVMKGLHMDEWARDPFLLIAHYMPGSPGMPGYYQLQALGAFDPRTRTMKVLDLVRGGFYDTLADPYARLRPSALIANRSPWFGFSVEWVDGSLRFDFPTTQYVNYPSGMALSTPSVTPTNLGGGFYGVPLDEYWRDYASGTGLVASVVPDSVTVRHVEVTQDSAGAWHTKVISALKQVYSAPHEGRDEFQLGTDPTGITGVPYGWIRLPTTLATADRSKSRETKTAIFLIEYRWRNNSVFTKDPETGLMVEKPDIIAAYYRTDAIVDISITVSRADPSAQVGQRISQSVFMTRRVKLHNLLREIRYGDNP